ncbi:winged helix-turn-helix domain-containing protein [Polyangium sp. 6x1]|uniref:winged helix-turn-helix domain-containing protein n=1 Tax=Polyangium sp. 6x1 TaxID=3042689 RepID=UPI002482F1A3|nr:winged helix-turn-helix domain-containing protein [Polyangium sp. 6x1]MDI1449526.1 winged helix-turn-helix domain-containing protein [Polyangium sp. 6x1]
MAEERRLPDEVARFIADHITSVEQLEILLLLRGAPDDEWTARAICEALRTSEQSVIRRLADLEAGGLVASRKASEHVVHRYAPASPSLDEDVARLSSAYTELRYKVLESIFSNPISNLHVYAEGFRFRKERDG